MLRGGGRWFESSPRVSRLVWYMEQKKEQCARKYIGDRVQRKLGDKKKSIFGTIIKERVTANYVRGDLGLRDELNMEYLVKWDYLPDDSKSWARSHLLTPLWPGKRD